MNAADWYNILIRGFTRSYSSIHKKDIFVVLQFIHLKNWTLCDQSHNHLLVDIAARVTAFKNI